MVQALDRRDVLQKILADLQDPSVSDEVVWNHLGQSARMALVLLEAILDKNPATPTGIFERFARVVAQPAPSANQILRPLPPYLTAGLFRSVARSAPDQVSLALFPLLDSILVESQHAPGAKFSATMWA